jgi:hypothetical protein
LDSKSLIVILDEKLRLVVILIDRFGIESHLEDLPLVGQNYSMGRSDLKELIHKADVPGVLSVDVSLVDNCEVLTYG